MKKLGLGITFVGLLAATAGTMCLPEETNMSVQHPMLQAMICSGADAAMGYTTRMGGINYVGLGLERVSIARDADGDGLADEVTTCFSGSGCHKVEYPEGLWERTGRGVIDLGWLRENSVGRYL